MNRELPICVNFGYFLIRYLVLGRTKRAKITCLLHMCVQYLRKVLCMRCTLERGNLRFTHMLRVIFTSNLQGFFCVGKLNFFIILSFFWIVKLKSWSTPLIWSTPFEAPSPRTEKDDTHGKTSHMCMPVFSWSMKIISRLIIQITATYNSSKMYLIL